MHSASTDSSTSGTCARRPEQASIRLASAPSRAARKRFSAITSGRSIAGSAPGALERLQPDEALHERAQRRRVGDGRLRVHDPDLDRPEARLQAHVPPQERRLRESLAAQQEVDRRDVVLVAGERARDPHARERLEQGRARGARPVSRPCQKGEFADSASSSGRCGAQADGGPASRSRRRAPRRGRAARTSADAPREPRIEPVQEAVAVALGDLRALPLRERVDPRDRRFHVEPASSAASCAAQALELAQPFADVLVRVGAQLQRRPVRLGARVGQQLARQSFHHRVRARGQRPVAGVEQHHHLLLDADRPRRHARGRPVRPPPRAGLRGARRCAGLGRLGRGRGAPLAPRREARGLERLRPRGHRSPRLPARA